MDNVSHLSQFRPCPLPNAFCGVWGERVVYVVQACTGFIARIAARFLALVAEIYAWARGQQPGPAPLQERQVVAAVPFGPPINAPFQFGDILGHLQARQVRVGDEIRLRGNFLIGPGNQILLDVPLVDILPRLQPLSALGPALAPALEYDAPAIDRSLLQTPPSPELELPRDISPMDVEMWKAQRQKPELARLDESDHKMEMSDSWSDIPIREVRTLIEHERARIGFSGQANLIPYLWTMMRPDLADETVIDFTQLVQTNPGTTSRQIFVHLLQETYGIVLAGTIAHRYGLYGDAPLTWSIVKQALVGIAANVKIGDLQELFEDLKRPVHERAMLCGCVLTHDFSRVEKFEDLSQPQINHLLKAFRTLPVGEKPFVPVMEFLKEGNGLPGLRYDCTMYDAAILERFSFSEKHFDQNNLYLAASEYHGKIIGYLELKEGMIVPMRDASGERVFYTVAGTLMEEGLVCHLLAPVNPKGTPSLFLNFRGTQVHPGRIHACASIQRDFDSSGIGKTVFERCERQILEMVRGRLEKSASVELHINGHSLGGVDTQRAAAAIVYEIARGQEDSLWRRIRSISATAHNPPGIEKELNEQFQKAVQSLPKDVAVSLTYVLFNSDPVQDFGDLYLGAMTPGIARRVILLESAQVVRLAAHSAKAFVGSERHPFQITVLEDGPELEKLLVRDAYGAWSYLGSAAAFAGRQARNAVHYYLQGLSAAGALLMPARPPGSFL